MVFSAIVPHVGPPEDRHQADHLSDQGGGDQREDDHRWEWAMMGRGCNFGQICRILMNFLDKLD